MNESGGEGMSYTKLDDKPVNKSIKRVQFFEAKQHVEIIRQVKGETAFIERQEECRNRNKRNG